MTEPRRLTNDEKWGKPFVETTYTEGYPSSRHLREREICLFSDGLTVCCMPATWLDRGRKVCKRHVGVDEPSASELVALARETADG